MSTENLLPDRSEINEDDLDTESTRTTVNIQSRSRKLMKNATSNMSSLMNFLKGNVGTGILAMPYAFAQSGLWVGFAGVLFLGVIATHCMHMLVNCSRKLCDRTSAMALDYPQLVECCLQTGPQKLRSTAKVFRRIIYVFIIASQFGVCCVYILFVAENMKQAIDYFGHKIVTGWYIMMTAGLLIPYCYIGNLKTLSFFSTLANIITICSLVIIIQYIVQNLPPITSVAAYKSLDTLPAFFGTALFAFEAINLVLPIENKMRTPQDFVGCTGVLNLGMVIVVCLYTAMGFYGYIQYGDLSKGSITLNLPTEWLYIVVKILLAISIFLSFGVQFYVPLNLLKPSIDRIESMLLKKIVHFAVRSVIIILLGGLAYFVPHLELLIALVGAFACNSLAIIFPPIVEMITYSAEGEYLSWIVIIKNILIILIGLLGFVTGTYISVRSMIRESK